MAIFHSYVILPEGISSVPSVDHKTRIRWIYPIKSPWYHVPFKTLVWSLICIRFWVQWVYFWFESKLLSFQPQQTGPQVPFIGGTSFSFMGVMGWLYWKSTGFWFGFLDECCASLDSCAQVELSAMNSILATASWPRSLQLLNNMAADVITYSSCATTLEENVEGRPGMSWGCHVM
jgi:hypothetical protein